VSRQNGFLQSKLYRGISLIDAVRRLPSLDGLRAISILLVLAAHMLPLGPKWLQLNSTAGTMGMSLFFALSGFLITSTLKQNSNVQEFLMKRFARIAPLAYAYVLVLVALQSIDGDAALWTMSFFLNYSHAHIAGANGHFWSLCVEVQFYAAIAMIVLLLGPKGLWIIWPACLMVTGLRIGAGNYISIVTHLRADEILAGACVATLPIDSRSEETKAPLLLICLAVVIWVLTCHPGTGSVQYLRPYASAALLAVFVWYAGSALHDVLSSHPLRYIAAISYALYVIHPLTLQGWMNTGGSLERYLLKRPLSFIATFAAAHVSTFYWERLWQRAGKDWIARRRLKLGYT
jgi:peptidoglycan/LPS O-acetylase OafA/YrhL